MANANKTFRTILQNLTCDRYADRDQALAAIDTAFQAGKLTEPERKRLTQHAK
jgi:hypothetical protein